MTPEHRQADAEKQATIRVATLSTSYRDFALQFHAMQIKNGMPRAVCVCGSMPALVLQWKGSGYPTLLQSLS